MRKTEGKRAIVGGIITAAGGTVLVVSGPGGWAFAAAAVTTEVGGILTVSDFVYIKTFVKKVLKKVEDPQKEREKIIDEVDRKTGGGGCPPK